MLRAASVARGPTSSPAAFVRRDASAADGKEQEMQLGRHMRLNIAAMLVTFVVAVSVHAGDAPGNSIITIGGVVYTDTQDPLRSGVAGVAVTVQGENGVFEATTAGILGASLKCITDTRRWSPSFVERKEHATIQRKGFSASSTF